MNKFLDNLAKVIAVIGFIFLFFLYGWAIYDSNGIALIPMALLFGLAWATFRLRGK